MLIFRDALEVSKFITSYFTVYSKDSRIVHIIDTTDYRVVGEAVLNLNKSCDGIYIEFLGIYIHERGKGYGRLAVGLLKEKHHWLYGCSINESRGFWGKVGVKYLDGIKKSFIIH